MKYLKHLFSTLLCLCSLTANAFKADGIYYNITDATNKTVEVTYKGDSYDSYSNEYTGCVVIPESVTFNGTNYFVTRIGERAFEECYSLTSIEIPNSVTSIEERAFIGCYKLTNVTIPNSVTSIGEKAFYNCKSFTSVVIGNSVTSIGEKAFYNCTGLKTVINYSNLRFSKNAYSYIAYYADKVINAPNGFKQDDCIWFENKGAMTLAGYLGDAVELDLPAEYNGKNVTSIGNDAFKNCTRLTSIVIPNSVTSIGDYAFYDCSGLTSIDIPNSVTSIGHYAFSYCSGLTNVVIENGVTSIGDYAFYYCSGLTNVVIGNSVTSIGDYAFYGCSGLTSIVIPNSVTSIGESAFSSCYGLTSVVIGNGVTSIGNDAFKNCTRLTSIVIPNSVTSIGQYAFQSCDGLKDVYISDIAAWCRIDFASLDANPLYYAKKLYLNGELVTELVIPEGVKEIKNHAFYYCSGLTSIVIPNSVTSIGEHAFYNCYRLTSVVIGNGVTSIGDYAFQSCDDLTSVEIGNSVKSIGNYAFSYCTGLTSIEIPNSVTSIGDYAFYKCTGLTSVVIGNSVTSFGGYAFSYCTGLTSVVIGNGVTSIGNYAFDGCSGLTSIVIPNSVTSIGSSAFYRCSGLKDVYISDIAAWCRIDFASLNANPLYYAKKLYLNGELVTELVIPNSVTSIGDYAFYDCSGLTSVVIGNSVKSIGNFAFESCDGLTSVVIGNGVTSIGIYAFSYCTGLTSVTIGSGVSRIYERAFAYCDNLADVYCLATSVPSTNAAAFNESYPQYMTLHVPAEAIDSYKTTAPWRSFGTITTLNEEDIEPEVPEIPEVKVCAAPFISYSDGNLHFECETEGAEFVTEITSSDFNKFYNNSINLSATYNISVYATATGYENSDIVNATLCWIECECEGDDTGIINIPAKAALVTSNGGVLSISCQLDGEEVAVYTTAGTLIGTTTIDNGVATVATDLSKGTVAIVKIADKSIKVIVD